MPLPPPPVVPDSYQRRESTFTRHLGRWMMRVWGWRFEGNFPDVPKVVVSVAPHTSNWDFVIGITALWALDIKINFIGKHTLFKGLFGRWLRSLGGIPVDRSAAHGVVAEVVRSFDEAERMVFALAPEGTRQLDKSFKTGFIHIAHNANVPILLAYFDFANKVVGFGPCITTSGDAEADLAKIVAFYRPVRGKYVKDWQK